MPRKPSNNEIKLKRLPKLLHSEYASFRSDIIDFFSNNILPMCKSIADPFCGTAPLIPHVEKAGITAFFNDILPIHYFLNKARTYSAYKAFLKAERIKRSHLKQEVIKCLSALRQTKTVNSDEWIHNTVLERLSHAWNKANSYKSSFRDLLRAIIVLCVRPYSSFVAPDPESNPTWPKKGGDSSPSNLSENVDTAIDRLRKYYSLYYNKSIQHKARCYFSHVNADRYVIKKKVDAIITSPPYNNRYELAQNYAPELTFFNHIGYNITSSMVLGTVRVKDYTTFETDLEMIKNKSRRTYQYLRHVMAHDTNSNYYLRYNTRYYAYLFAILERMLKYLNPKGKMYVVVQSNIHKAEINDLGAFIEDYFKRRKKRVKRVFIRPRPHLGRRNISATFPLFVRKHEETILEIHR